MNESPFFISDTGRRGKAGEFIGLYRCVCGRTFTAMRCEVKRGRKKSCGCFARGWRASLRARTHGESLYGGSGTTKEYRVWLGMKQRCNDALSPSYDRYGGRGIKVCDRWVSSYETFLADMGRCPEPRYSLNRKDNDGPYSPENCEWASPIAQANNRKGNKRVTINGESRTIAEWCAKTGAKRNIVYQRIKKGWEPSRALSDPPIRHGDRNKIAIPLAKPFPYEPVIPTYTAPH